jgi:arginine deiminase
MTIMEKSLLLTTREEAIARILAGFGPKESITPPGTLEGGDVLCTENHYYIGISERINTE